MPKYGSFSGPHFPVFSPNTGKYGPEKIPYLDTFHAVILLISSCPMNGVKVEKLPIIPSYACNFISKSLKGDRNICSTVQRLSLIVLCWKSRLCVDFKVESALFLSHQQAMRKKKS